MDSLHFHIFLWPQSTGWLSSAPFSACWVFSCFHNPPNSDMDYRIFNISHACVHDHSYVCAYTHGLGTLTVSQHSTFDSEKLTIFSCAPDRIQSSVHWILSLMLPYFIVEVVIADCSLLCSVVCVCVCVSVCVTWFNVGFTQVVAMLSSAAFCRLYTCLVHIVHNVINILKRLTSRQDK